MTLPANWPTVHITGTYVELDGTPCKGQVIFVAPRELSIDGVVVLPRKLMFDLDASGAVAGDVPASDYPADDPTWAYEVIEQLVGHPPHSRQLIIPQASDTLDLATAVAVAIDDAEPAYRLEIGTVEQGATAAASLTPVSRHVQKLNLTLPQGAVGGLPAGGDDDDVLTKQGDGAKWAPATIQWQSTNW